MHLSLLQSAWLCVAHVPQVFRLAHAAHRARRGLFAAGRRSEALISAPNFLCAMSPVAQSTFRSPSHPPPPQRAHGLE